MLFRILKKSIEKDITDGLEEKIDVFYAANKLTETEYTTLIDLLHSTQV